MARKRNKKTIINNVRLERYAAEGKSIGTLPDGKTVFVSGAVPGDVVDILIRKNKSSYAEGMVMSITEPSPDRGEPFCEHFEYCGGCKWQMLPYEKQLEYKQIQVNDQLKRLSHIQLPEIQTILGCDQDRRYRNKLEFTFSALEYLPKEIIERYEGEEIPNKDVLGFHAPGFFDKIVDIQECHLMVEPTNKIKNLLRTFTQERKLTYFNHRTKQGFLRNLVIRISTLGEVMVNLIVSEYNNDLMEMLQMLQREVPEITTLLYTINNKANDTIYDLEVNTFSGKGFIEEKLEDFTFKISPKSFFQTNSRQGEKLYQIVRDFANLQGSETLYDFYCGTGSIGIFLSPKAKKIIGIDSVAEAIEDARINASINGLENTVFFSGDVIKVVNDDFFAQHGFPDVIVTDPPRAGMHEKMVEQLLSILAPKIVYVSCNPATQARDLQLLDEKYQVTRIQPVDMFPQTHHIECVALLELRDNIQKILS